MTVLWNYERGGRVNARALITQHWKVYGEVVVTLIYPLGTNGE